MLFKQATIFISVLFALNLTIHVRAEEAPNYQVELPSSKIEYRDNGIDAEAILFLHAGSGNMSLWDYQVNFFSAQGYRFLAINYKSLDPKKRHTAINELLDFLEIEQFHMLGTAAGGGLALGYVLKNPQRLKTVVIANSIGNVEDADYAAMSERYRPRALFKTLPTDFLELGPSYRAVNPEGTARWKALSGAHDRMPPPPKKSTSVDNPETAITWTNLAKLKMPLLFITGDADLYTPPAVLRLFKHNVPQSQIAIIADAGHSAYWESPDEFNKTVLTFIRSNEQ